MDVSAQSLIREHNSAASEGPALLFLKGVIILFFSLFFASCNCFDVVSGCGKNAGGAAETVVFHNLPRR